MKRKEAYRGKLRPWTLKISILTVAWLSLSVNLTAYAQLPGADPVARGQLPSGLQIGDEIPKELWNERFKVVNHPEGKDSITLNDYKDKLLILDFGATYCPPCIRSIRKLDSLEGQFGGRFRFLPVTTEKTERVEAFLDKSGYDVSFIAGGMSLVNLFPHHTTPHLAWIWKGEVIAITEFYYATGSNIKAVLKGKKVSLPVKSEWRDLTTVDTWVADSRLGETLLYESVITGYTPGGWPLSETGQGNKVTLVNLGVYGLYIEVISILNPELRTVNRVLLEMDDSLRRKVTLPKQYRSDERKKDEWRQANGYSYHLKVPEGFSQEAIGQIALKDLNSFFINALNITGRIEKRKVKCLALVRTNDQHDLLQTKYPGKKSVSFGDDGSPLMQNVPFDGLVRSVSYCLNELPTPVVDRTGYEGNVDYDVRLERGNVEAVRKELQRYGLDLREEELEINMLVISERRKI